MPACDPIQPLDNCGSHPTLAAGKHTGRAILIFRIVISLIASCVFYGAIFGVMYFVVGEDRWIELRNIGIFSAITVGLITAFAMYEPNDALWDALKLDYPESPSLGKGVLRSAEGNLISSSLDDQSFAVTSATKYGIHLKQTGPGKRKKHQVSIPWSKIKSIEVVRPDESVLKKAESVDVAPLLDTYLTAKVELDRSRNALTLAIPWNGEFRNYVPESVEITQDWSW